MNLKVNLKVGDKIFYPFQGPCVVVGIAEQVMHKQTGLFYQLSILNDGGGSVFVPVEKLDAGGFRLLLDQNDVAEVLHHLENADEADLDWKCRVGKNRQRFASGTPFDLVEIVHSLTATQETKSLSFVERRMLDHAKMMLVGEIAEATGESRATTEARINRLLERQRRAASAYPARLPFKKQASQNQASDEIDDVNKHTGSRRRRPPTAKRQATSKDLL